MTYIRTTDSVLELAKGNVPGHSTVNKFGRNIDVDSGATADVWDNGVVGANLIWDAPTSAVPHNIVSTSTDDAAAGVGARTIQVYGLTSWSTSETSEVITMNGTSNVLTSNSYVIIHRIKVLTKGATNVNVGVITATASGGGGLVTAKILAGEGQTQMAIYGIPSTQTAYMTAYYASINRSVSTGAADIEVVINPEPDVELTNFLVKHTQSLQVAGSGYMRHEFNPYYTISGPAIIKIQATPSVNTMDVSAGFDLILVDN